VTDVGAFLKLVERFAPSEPTIICMKGPKWQQELALVAEDIQTGALELIRTLEFQLPFSGAERCLMVLKILAKQT